MSRHIEPKASVTITEEELNLRKTDRAKLLFTSYQGRDCALYLQNDRLVEAAFLPKESSKVGAVYIGRIANVVKNIDACFVEIAKKELCFVSLQNVSPTCLLNRRSAGKIAAGDELLVQITRDAAKTKQAVASAHLTFENDYFVLSTGNPKVCYSSKLTTKQKERIRQLLADAGLTKEGCMVQSWHTLLPEQKYQRFCEEGFLPEKYPLPEMGFIVRTRAGELEHQEELLAHFHAISVQMAKLQRLARHRSCYTCLKEPPTGHEAVIHQFLSDSSSQSPLSPENTDPSLSEKNLSKAEEREIITDQQALYEMIQQKMPQSETASCSVRLYQDSMLSLSALYSVDSRLEAALNSRVWLKSGAYLVIEATEALTVIDVNSGKFSSGKVKPNRKSPDSSDSASAWSLERAACLEVNLEAAREVAAQLRLRNLSGIIIVDFISMRAREDNAELLRYLRELVKYDRISTTVVDMTPLGLVEITRKKINKPLKEQFQKYFANS